MDRSTFYLKIHFLLVINMCIFLLGSPLYAAEKESINMGYWLDRAAYFCDKNKQVKLDATLQKITTLITQSSIANNDKRYINHLLNQFHQGECNPLASSMEYTKGKLIPSKWYDLWQKVNNAQDQYTQLKTSLSYANNINSGSRHRFISVNNFLSGSDEDEIRLSLDQANLPQSDVFNEFSIKHQRPIHKNWSIYAAYYHQKYKRYKQYNLTVLELGLKEKINNKNIGKTLYDISAKTTLLNKLHWQNALSLSTTMPLKMTDNFAIYWQNRLNYSYYIQQKEYNAVGFYSSIKYLHKLSDHSSIQIKGAVQHDHALNNRPGQHRNTVSASISTQYRLPRQWEVKTALQVKQRIDSEVYSQALFGDKKRQQKLSHFGLSLRKPLGQKKSMTLDYTVSQTHDKNIPLFDTEKNQYLGIGMEFNW